MTTETTFAPAARRDLNRLDPQVAQRVLRAVRRYVEADQGDVRRLQAAGGELRLRVGDWRVRFTDRIETRPAEPPTTGTVSVRVVEVLRIVPRGRAYRS